MSDFDLGERLVESDNKKKDNGFYWEKDVKRFIKEIKKQSHTTHSCPDDEDDYECRCFNKKIPDQNCWVIPKSIFNKIIGKKLLKC